VPAVIYRPDYALFGNFVSFDTISEGGWYWAMGLCLPNSDYRLSVAAYKRENHTQAIFHSANAPPVFPDVRLSRQLTQTISALLCLCEGLTEDDSCELLSRVLDEVERAHPDLAEKAYTWLQHPKRTGMRRI